MLLILILLLTTIPIIEIFLLLQVGEAIGTWNTVGIVIFTGLLGAYALRTQGRAIFRRLELKLYRGELPTNPIVHSLFILIGGILMITPGLLTDLVGFGMVLPFTRPLFVGIFKSFFRKFGQVHVRTYRATENPFHGQWKEVPSATEEIKKSKTSLCKADIIDLNAFKEKNNQNHPHSTD